MLSNKELAFDRLVAAARTTLARQGLAASSARSIAACAGLAPSAINYNFGKLEHLFGASFESGLHDAKSWMATKTREAQDLPAGPDAAVAALESLVLAWVEDARDLALLYQEVLIAGGPLAAHRASWLAAWADFFEGVARHFQLPPQAGVLMNLMFQSEAIYALSQWRPMLERAALGEMLGHFGAFWLGAAPRPAFGALAAAEAAVRLPQAAPTSEQARAFIDAAVAVVEDLGLDGLTHRAVAARCGATAGAVAHYFRTADDLLAAAVRGQVLALQARFDADGVRAGAVQSLEDFARDFTSGIADAASLATIQARRSLFMASMRLPGRAAAGAAVRFAQGATVAASLRACMPDNPAMNLHASLLSRLLSASTIATLADPQREESACARATLVVNVFVARVAD